MPPRPALLAETAGTAEDIFAKEERILAIMAEIRQVLAGGTG